MNATALSGWRARAWAWVLFLALFKGLVPHAALASVLMSGNPALMWCAPGAGASDVKAGGTMTAAAHDCVCASSGDGTLPLGQMAVAPAQVVQHTSDNTPRAVALTHRALPPPARGPPES